MNPLLQFLQSKNTAPSSPFSAMMSQSTPTGVKKPVLTAAPGSPSATAPAPAPDPVKTNPAKAQFVSSLTSSNGPSVPGSTAVPGQLTGTQSSNNPYADFLAKANGSTTGSTTGAGTTGTGTTGGTPSSYDSAYQAYISSLVPSDTETTASKYLNDLILQSKKDQEDALGRGETLGFASGEAARVNKNNQFGIDAASDALTALTGARKSTTDANKARVDYETSLLPKQQSISDQYGTGSIGEYNFAKANGYTGSFTDYQNEDANRKAKAAGSAAPKIFGSDTSGYFTLNNDGSATPITLKPSVSWEDYLKAAEDELSMNLNPDSDAYKQLKQQYTSTYSKSAVGGGGDNAYGL